VIGLIDIGGSNIASIENALRRLKQKWILIRSSDALEQTTHSIIPGVCHVQRSMKLLKKANLLQAIRNYPKPILGICSGMQLLFDYSEEGRTSCMGIIPGKVRKLASKMKVPHIGWNKVTFLEDHPLDVHLPDNKYGYFVHSYVVRDLTNAVATVDYGEIFASVVQKNNFYGVQFHPEKSAWYGEKFLKNFLNL